MDISDYQKACIHEEIEAAYGRAVRYSRDCDALSRDIFEQTERQLSGTTLKRFFGLASGHHDPSVFTLDTLAIYAGFSSWETFVRDNQLRAAAKPAPYQAIFNDKTSENQFKRLKIKQLSYSVPFFYPLHGLKRFESFLKSEKPFHAIITEMEYLPANLIYQFTDFLIKGLPFVTRDVTLSFFDADAFQWETDGKPHNLPLPVDTLSHIHAQIARHISQNPGYYVVFVYNLRDYPAHPAIDLLYSMMHQFAHHKQLKFVFSCTPAFWRMFSERHRINAQHDRLYWHYVRFVHSEKHSYNVPKISQKELGILLSNHQNCISLSKIQIHYPGLWTFLRIPQFLDIYLKYQCKTTRHFNEIDYFQYLIRRALYTDKLAAAKQEILQELISRSDYLKSSIELPRKTLQLPGLYPEAYHALSQSYLLTERLDIRPFEGYRKMVKIRYRLIAEYLTVLTWLRQYGFRPQLLQKIRKHYPVRSTMRTNLWSWIIKFTLVEQQFDFLLLLIRDLIKSQHITPQQYFINPHLFPEFSSLFTSLRNTPEDEQMIKNLTRAPHICELYYRGFFELDHMHTMHSLLQYCPEQKKRQGAIHLSIQLIYATLHQRNEEADTHYAELTETVSDDTYPFQFFARNLYTGLTNKQAITSPDELPDKWRSGESANSLMLLFFHCHTLLFIEKAEELASWAQKTASKLRQDKEFSNSSLLEPLKMMQAYGTLYQGEIEQAGTLLDATDTNRFPVSSRIYWSMWYRMIRGRFFMAIQEAMQAKIDFQKAEDMAEALGYPLLQEKLRQLHPS